MGALDRIGRQGGLAFGAERAVLGVAGLGGDGQPLLPGPPGARLGKALPGPLNLAH